MALPATLARFTDNGAVTSVAKFIYPGGAGYIPVNVALICFFNYFYTFLQLDPKDVAEQLKRQGASIPGVRPGKNTREYITRVLERGYPCLVPSFRFPCVDTGRSRETHRVANLQRFRRDEFVDSRRRGH